jgi:hypothetical protein
MQKCFLFLIAIGGCTGAAAIDHGIPDDAAAPVDAAGGDDAMAPAGGNRFGSLSAWSNRYTAGGMTQESGGLSASFFDSTGLPTPADPCTYAKSGQCTLTRCHYTQPGSPSPPARSAGTVSVTGGVMPLSISPAADETYKTALVQQALWNGGEYVTLAGSGGDVPAFSLVLAAPNAVAVSSPALPATGSGLTLDRSHDLQLQWSGQSAGELQFVAATTNNVDLAQVACSFAVTLGAGSVPSQLLGALAPGPGTIGAQVVTRGSAQSGDWSIGAIIYSDAVDAVTGLGYAGGVDVH